MEPEEVATPEPAKRPKKADVLTELKKRLALAEAARDLHTTARSEAEKARRLAEKEIALIKDEMLKLTAG